jgi:hypothetical protein
MSKHTPGPWIGAGPSFGDPLPRYTTSIMTEWEHEDDGFIEICEFPFHHHDGENEANARLIAAAPDLLEALKGVLKVERGSSGRIILEGWHEEAICAAIAKATGETK